MYKTPNKIKYVCMYADFTLHLVVHYHNTGQKSEDMRGNTNVRRMVSNFLKCRQIPGVPYTRYLKEHCHEDFAVFGQFCAKIITLRLKS